MKIGNKIKFSECKNCNQIKDVVSSLIWDYDNLFLVREETWIKVIRNTHYQKTFDESNNLIFEFNPPPRIPKI